MIKLLTLIFAFYSSILLAQTDLTAESEWSFLNRIHNLKKDHKLAEAKDLISEARKKYPSSQSLYQEDLKVTDLINVEYQKKYKAVKAEYDSNNFETVIKMTSKLEKQDFFLRFLRFYSLMERSLYKLAQEELKILRTHHEYSIEVLHAALEFDLKTQNTNDAGSILNSLKNKKKDTATDHYRLAYLYTQLGDFDNATIELNESLEKEENYYHAYELLGYIESLRLHNGNSIRDYKKAISLQKNDLANYINLDEVYGRENQNDESLAILKDALKVFPHNHQVLDRLGYHYEISGDFYKAKEAYQNALKYTPGDIYAQKGLERSIKQVGSNILVQYSHDHNSVKEVFQNLNPKNRIEINSYLVKTNTIINKKLSAGLSYRKETYEYLDKLSTDNILLNAQYWNGKFSLNSLVGMNYYNNNKAEDNVVVGSIYGGYQLGNHNLSIGYNHDVDFEELKIGSSLQVKELNYFLAQDQIIFGHRFSLLIRGMIATSKFYNYNYSTIAGTYNFKYVPGLKLRGEFDYVALEDGINYSQQTLAAIYEKNVSDRFLLSFDLDVIYESQNKDQTFSAQVTTSYDWNSKITTYQNLRTSKMFTDDEFSGFGLDFGLKYHF